VVGAGAQIVGGATLAAFCPGDAATEEGPALGVLALEQRAHVFSFRVDEPAELRAAAQRAGQGALGIVFADPAAPLQRLLGARRTLQTALNRLAGPPPAFGIYFDCASRGTTLYGVDGLDLDLIEKSLGPFPLLSLRTSFELGPAGDALGVHLFTGVLALGDQ